MKIPLNNIIHKIQVSKGLGEEDIQKMISNKVKELEGLVSEEGAAHIVANELGVVIFSETAQDLTILEIKSNMRNITVVGKVVSIYDVISFERNSNPGKVRSLVLADKTGRIRCSFWHGAVDALSDVVEGMIIKLTGVVSRENNGRVELSVSSADNVSKNPEGVVIEDVAPQEFVSAKSKKIVEIDLNDRFVSLIGTIIQVFRPGFYHSCPECRRKVELNGEEFSCKTHGVVTPNLSYVSNIVLDDGTETIRCVFFNEQLEKLTGFDNSKMVALEKDPNLLDIFKELLLGRIVKLSGGLKFNDFSKKMDLSVNDSDFDFNIEKEIENLNN